MQLSWMGKIFSQFFSSFTKSTSNLEYFEKEMSLRVDFFFRLETAKSGLT